MRLFAPGRKLLGMNIVSEVVAVIALACLWMAPTCVAQANASTHSSPPKSSVCPAEPCVPDQKTAVRIAEAVLIPVYGEKHIISERPFTARLEGERWVVKGSLPKARPGYLIFGGTAMAEINKQDGRILAVYHLK